MIPSASVVAYTSPPESYLATPAWSHPSPLLSHVTSDVTLIGFYCFFEWLWLMSSSMPLIPFWESELSKESSILWKLRVVKWNKQPEVFLMCLWALCVSTKLMFSCLLETHLACTSELHEANPKKHGKLQTIFKGNNTAMHTHIQHMGMSHYHWYHEMCMQQSIDIDEWCVLQEELDHLEGKATNT